MERYGMLINIDKCNGCYNCFLSCRDEYEGNDYLPYSAAQGKEGKSWMRLTEIERGSTPKVKVDYIPVPCLQCNDATCLTSDGAVYRREDGIIIIDPEKSIGKKEIVSKCPHRVINWNEEKNIPQKCTFCAHLLDKGWKEPRCVESCPSGALVFGDLDDANSEVSKLIASTKNEELNPAFKLKSNVRYIDLPKRFIAGEVVLGDNLKDCAPGIKVLLTDGKKTLERKTDNFGDFEFDGLEASKKYIVRVEHKGYKTAEQEVVTYSDVNMGAIELAPDKKPDNKLIEKKVKKVTKKTIKKPAKVAIKKAAKAAAKKSVKKQVKKGKKSSK